MSLFDKLVDVFFEPVPPTAAANRPTNAGAPGAQNISTPTMRPTSTVTGAANIDQRVYQEFSDSLRRAMETENLPGFDFFEFHQLYLRFLSEGKNDGDALQAALISAETMRIDRNTLIANSRHYQQVLEKEKNSFDTELKKFFEENIKGPKLEQDRIDSDIKAKEAQIKSLQAEIEQLIVDKKNMGINAAKATDQLDQVQASFQKAYEESARDLKAVVDKLHARGK